MTELASTMIKHIYLTGMICLLPITTCLCTGCNNLPLITPEELAAFNEAGPVQWQTDLGQLKATDPQKGPYRVMSGDLLSLTIPSMAPNPITPDATELVLRRVADDGTIILPAAGPVKVAGQTLTQVEASIAGSYFPKLLVEKPAVVAEVKEYRTVRAAVTGGVVNPGIYALHSDEASLLGLLTKAGGIVPTGAHVIRVTAPGSQPEAVAIPVKGLNVPFTDVALQGGENVEVDKLRPQTVTVLGLVKAPGVFPYLPDTPLNLAQAIGLAGGTDMIADPRYAVVYREDQKGELVTARFKLNAKARDNKLFADSSLAANTFTAIKPGDVIMIEHNGHTRTRQALNLVIIGVLSSLTNMVAGPLLK